MKKYPEYEIGDVLAWYDHDYSSDTVRFNEVLVFEKTKWNGNVDDYKVVFLEDQEFYKSEISHRRQFDGFMAGFTDCEFIRKSSNEDKVKATEWLIKFPDYQGVFGD